MPDVTPSLNEQVKNPNLPPPSGDPNQAVKYVNQLIQLVDTDKLDVVHTDLSKFDPTSLQDHYSMELKDYKVEVSHSKYPNSGKDSYVILFTNIKHVVSGNSEKIILAYLHLDDSQFNSLKKSFSSQIDRKRREEEEKRLKEAMTPIDKILEQLETKSREIPEENPQNLDNQMPPLVA